MPPPPLTHWSNHINTLVKILFTIIGNARDHNARPEKFGGPRTLSRTNPSILHESIAPKTKARHFWFIQTGWGWWRVSSSSSSLSPGDPICHTQFWPSAEISSCCCCVGVLSIVLSLLPMLLLLSIIRGGGGRWFYSVRALHTFSINERQLGTVSCGLWTRRAKERRGTRNHSPWSNKPATILKSGNTLFPRIELAKKQQP